MKFIILSILITLSFLSTEAEYIARVPLEINQGGSLPNSSIIFSNEQQPTEENKVTWDSFAEENGLSKNWNLLIWSSRGLLEIPKEPYPLTTIYAMSLSANMISNLDGLSNLNTVDYNILLGSNNFTNINGLSNLTTVGGTIDISSSTLTDVNGLINLTSVGNDLLLHYNFLTNVDALINLTSVGGNLWLSNNQLNNINGLANLKVSNLIVIDKTYSGPKLPSNTRFCIENSPAQFGLNENVALKTDLCES